MRQFTGKARLAIWCIAAVLTVFELYTEATTPLPRFTQNSIPLLLGFVLVLLLYPAIKRKKGGGWLVLDIILCLSVVAVAGHQIIANPERMSGAQFTSPPISAIILGTIFIILTLEVVRRTMGNALVITALVFIAYAFLGPYIPGVLGHEGNSIQRFISYNYLTELGPFGMMLDIASGVIFAVVAFGAFMLALGGGDMIINVAKAIAGKYRGGPAKVAVVGSAFFGTVSGSSVANVVGTGVYTIPMMKRLGYQSEFAGAVEACASTGGQIMPPVMGTAAFIMCQLLNIPYGKLILYALIPALFYFITIFFQVDFRAAKLSLKGSPPEEQVRLRDIPKADWIMLLPIFVLIYLLVVVQLTVIRGAFYSSISVWVCFIIRELVTKRRVDLKKLVTSFETPARQMLTIIAVGTILGTIMFTIDLTGLATKLSMVLLQIAGNNLILLLVMTMVASLILGMGLPTIPCYIFLAILAAPALVKLGVLPLAAHMFIFYFGMISAITPPVAVASFVAAAIAQTDGMKVGLQATKLGIAGYVVPYMFVLAPSLLMQGPPVEIIVNSLSLLVATYALAAAVEGYMLMKLNIPMRIASLAAAVLLIIPILVPTLIGLGLLILLIVIQRLSLKRQAVIQTASN